MTDTLDTIEQYGVVEYTRSQDFFNPTENPYAHVTIVGCGGIGSFAAHSLAKLGIPSLTLVDFDSVEAHNVPNQFYRMEDVGASKVEALASALAETTRAEITSVLGAVTEDGLATMDGDKVPLSGVVISALDSMDARSLLWDAVKMQYPVSLFLDGRLGGQNIVVYAANPVNLDDVKGYEATLHSDEEAVELPCTGRNVIDVGYAMAAILTRHVRKHLADEVIPKVVFQDQDGLSMFTSGEWLS